jgi:hypothetical protein
MVKGKIILVRKKAKGKIFRKGRLRKERGL